MGSPFSLSRLNYALDGLSESAAIAKAIIARCVSSTAFRAFSGVHFFVLLEKSL